MAKTLEQLANEIYKECIEEGEEVTKEEALEMAKMEIKSKDFKRYEKDITKQKKKVVRERKVDEEKGYILTNVKTLLEEMNATIENMKTETEIKFSYNNNSYTIKLTKHRPKK